jgi:hydrogenase maturation protein HypF
VIRSVADDVRRGLPAAEIAARFHAGVAALVVSLANQERGRTGLDVVALSGGVFQNATLLDATVTGLQDHAFTVLRPRLLPPNDGGIALGQILIGSVT